MSGEKRKQIRLTHYDYSHPGAYFITICTAGREKLFWEADEKNCEPGGDAPTISRIINQFKGAVTKAVGRPIWQKGYYDHVIRNEQDYLDIWDYIDTNPVQEREVKFFSETEGIPWQSKKTKRPM